MEKTKIHFIIGEIQQWKDEVIQDEEGNSYQHKYLITTQPFTFRGQEYSQLEIYTNYHLEFQDLGFADLIKDSEKENLKKYLWEIWWWENQGDDYYPAAKIDETKKKITVPGKLLTKMEKVRFSGNSLTVSPTENGSKWDEERGRLEIKIKPVKIEEGIEINQLDFCVGKFFGDDVRQVIFDNFSFGKLVNVYFAEKGSSSSHSGSFIELNSQTKLVISPLDLKNKFKDYSWFSSADDQWSSVPRKEDKFLSASVPSNNGGKWFFFCILLPSVTLVFFCLYRQISKKNPPK